MAPFILCVFRKSTTTILLLSRLLEYITMTEPRANAARADDHEQPGIANQSSHSSLRTTPLLLLLDGVLSKDEARVADAMNDILYTLRVYALWNENLINDDPSQSAPLHYTEVIESPCNSAASLERVLNALLDQYPHLAQIPSDHDGSLPLHFAASLGNVPAAVTILQSVSLFFVLYPNFILSFCSNFIHPCLVCNVVVPTRRHNAQSKRKDSIALCGP